MTQTETYEKNAKGQIIKRTTLSEERIEVIDKEEMTRVLDNQIAALDARRAKCVAMKAQLAPLTVSKPEAVKD